MSGPVRVPQVQLDLMSLCIDAEIARARLGEMIEACDDITVLWISDMVHRNLRRLATRLVRGELQ